MGNGFSIDPQSRDLLLVAGGMGIAPLCFLAWEALKIGKSAKLLAGAKTACEICPGTLLPPGLEMMTATEDGTLGEKGLIALLPDIW
jgi:dihydroorotate dehydrogenase electron transfer subunit